MAFTFPPFTPPTDASVFVREVLDESETLASQAQTQALAAITALGAFSLELPAMSVPSIPVPTITALPLDPAPDAPAELAPAFPPAPAEPAVGSSAPFQIGDEPAYDLAPPLLLDVPLPDPFDVLVPPAPELNGAVIPVEPDYVLPPVPTMLGLNLPDAPQLDLPLFTDTVGAAPSVPDASFTWAEVEYDSTLLTGLNTRLVTLIAGAHTGLDPDVEAALWNRGRDRQALIAQRGAEEAVRTVAARGFAIPPGTLVRLVQQAVHEGMRNDADLSRDIMIKQAELEQSNFQFAFNAAMQLEGQLISAFNQVQARALDAAKYQFEAVIQLLNARIALFNADVQAFGVKAQVFKTRLEGALAQLQVYQAELEGQRLIGELNKQAVAVYAAQLDGVRAIADIYKSRIEGVKVTIEFEKERVEIYKAQLGAYDSQVKAKTAEYDGYASRVKAELTKVQMFGEQVSAFKARTDAYGVLVNAKLNAANLDFKQTQEFPVELYKSRVQAYQAAVGAEGERLRSLATVFESRVRAYAASEQAKATFTGAEVEAVKASTAVYTSSAQLALQAGEINMKLATSAAETAQTSLRAAGQLSGQLAAAALSARHVSAAVSASDSNSMAQSQSYSASDSTSYSQVSNHVDSTSNSTSHNENYNHNYKE